MIREYKGVFFITSEQISYVFRVSDTGHLEHLYYGQNIHTFLDDSDMDETIREMLLDNLVEALTIKNSNLNGSAIKYDKEHDTLCMNDHLLEISTHGTGDMRSPMIELIWEDGSRTSDFIFEEYEILDNKYMLSVLPSSYDTEHTSSTLKIVLKENYHPVKLELYYSIFEDCHVLTRSCLVRNEGEQSVTIKRLMSAQLDFAGTSYTFTTFHGDWAREMGRTDQRIAGGRVVSTSLTGFSSSHANPFIMLFEEGSSETCGEGYGCNLIYSGSHMEIAETSSQGQTRFLTGINPEQFTWNLDTGEILESPEAVFTYSNSGYEGISRNMHCFVREHIVRGSWKTKERPVLLNSWEASYFNFSENRLLKLAKAGKDVGIELFVMDDGWFGERNNDKSSLGDWEVNRKKLPGGIKGLAEKINAMGLQFGIWVEPEMVNEDSNLYRTHPDWTIRIPGRNHGEGRNQMLLDLTREEVQEYLIDSMSKVFSEGNITYVKWDMNRNFSDIYSGKLAPSRQGEVLHRYILGLYRIMGELNQRFPNILFEGCASGGNRFDLGILCYMPQIWASDNSDAISRCYIQNGLSYGYPQSVIGAHVSSCPNHQTLRNTPLETRFAVASMGVLGYECNLNEMKREDLHAIKEQIAIYKKWRATLQYGQLYRIGGTLNLNLGRVGKPDSQNLVEWIIVSQTQETAVSIMVQETVKPHTSQLMLRTRGLKEDLRYHVYGRNMKYDIRAFGDLINMIAPIHIKKDSLLHNTVARFVKLDGEEENYLLYGRMLNRSGICLAQSFAGTGYGKNTRVYQDFDSRMYFFERG